MIEPVVDRYIVRMADALDAAIAYARQQGAAPDDIAYRALAPPAVKGTLAKVRGRIVQPAAARPDGKDLVAFTLNQTLTLRERLERLALQMVEADPPLDRTVALSGDEALARIRERAAKHGG